MASNAPGACCISGVKHEGESVGEIKEIDGRKYYLSYPKDKKTEYAILYLCDAFGIELVNNRLLADSMADSGYFVVMPDLFLGNPVPEDAFNTGKNFDIMAWVGQHPMDRVDETIDTAVKTMRGKLGAKKIGAVGYCFGGKYVIRFLAEGKGVDAGFVAHPSMVDSSELEAITKPLSVAAAEVDQTMPKEKRHETEDILQKLGHPYQLALYGHVVHGFAVRCDLKDRRQKFAKESAGFQAIRWFDEFVKG